MSCMAPPRISHTPIVSHTLPLPCTPQDAIGMGRHRIALPSYRHVCPLPATQDGGMGTLAGEGMAQVVALLHEVRASLLGNT